MLSKPMLAALGYLARSIQVSPALEAVSVSCAHDSLMLSCCERGHARAMTKFLHAARDQLSARCVLRYARARNAYSYPSTDMCVN